MHLHAPRKHEQIPKTDIYLPQPRIELERASSKKEYTNNLATVIAQ